METAIETRSFHEKFSAKQRAKERDAMKAQPAFFPCLREDLNETRGRINIGWLELSPIFDDLQRPTVRGRLSASPSNIPISTELFKENHRSSLFPRYLEARRAIQLSLPEVLNIL